MERKQSEGEEDVSVLFEAQSKGEVDKEKDSREDMVSKYIQRMEEGIQENTWPACKMEG